MFVILQTQLITSKGYPCEDYDVHTSDGYILGIQRIPGSKTEKEKRKGLVLFTYAVVVCLLKRTATLKALNVKCTPL